MHERVICAAIKYRGKVYYGHRHLHALDALHSELSWYMNRQEMCEVHNETIEGFVTTLGRFVDRTEGYKIQTGLGIESAAKQHGDDYRHQHEELFSEDLY